MDGALGQNDIQAYTQTLDMEKAQLVTRFSIGDKAEVSSTMMMALRAPPYTAMNTLTITANKDITITPMSVIEAPVHLTDVRNYYAEIDRPLHALDPTAYFCSQQPFQENLKWRPATRFILKRAMAKSQLLYTRTGITICTLAKFTKTLKRWTNTFSVVASSCASNQYDDPTMKQKRLTILRRWKEGERLLKRHLDAWSEIWKSNVTVEGSTDITRDIRFALYNLYSFSREGTAYSLSPMGLSGLDLQRSRILGYWTMDVSPMLLMQPEMAKSFLEYRYQRLEAAKRMPFHMVIKERCFRGSPQQKAAKTHRCGRYRSFQHHITGCVGWAFWKYYQVTKDKTWLRERGWPVLKRSSRFLGQPGRKKWARKIRYQQCDRR